MTIEEAIRSNKLLILDGGFATEAEKQTALTFETGLWSSQLLADNDQTTVINVHRGFVSAGCDIIETNTYHCALDVLCASGRARDQAIDVCTSGVKLARQAIHQYRTQHPDETRPIYVAGSIGPYGVLLHDCSEYNGHYMKTTDHKDVISYHLGQARVLCDAGVDILAFETVPSMVEAECILQAIDMLKSDIPTWISFSCNSDSTTCAGDNFVDAVRLCVKHQRVLAVGINCTHPSHVSSLMKSAQQQLNGKRFVVYPNSGERYTKQKRWQPSSDDRSLIDYAQEWRSIGACIIGGCCRVYAEDIRRLCDAMKK